MANEEQLSILKQGVEVWNRWREDNPNVHIDLFYAKLSGFDLQEANLWEADLRQAILWPVNLSRALLGRADLSEANLTGSNLSRAYLDESIFYRTAVGYTTFGYSDLSKVVGLEEAFHNGPSTIGTDTIAMSRGKIPEAFLRGCGLSDWEIEETKLYNPDLSNEQVNKILYRIYDLRATQALQISPLFVSYSHGDNRFVDKIGDSLTQIGIRYWRDIHDMKSGRIEQQIDRAIRQNPTVLLVLSINSLSSDWVEHEVHTARGLEKEIGRDVLCPVALDDSWKYSRWPKRIMEQITEYNILDFSEWQDERKFESMFRRLIDGLEVFYKG
jgi:hypothetical protein